MKRSLAVRTLLATCVLGTSYQAYTRDYGGTAPAVMAEDPEYSAPVYRTGAVTFTTNINGEALYDNNIYALPEDAIDDVVFNLTPGVNASLETSNVELSLFAEGELRRYLDNTTEDAEGALIGTEARINLSSLDALTLGAQRNRAIEDRGDPEARDTLSAGPRIYEITTVQAGYRRDGGRLFIKADVEARKTNAVAAADAERDRTSYSAVAALGIRAGAVSYITATGFFSKREFRIDETPAGVQRNSQTFGGRIGMNFDPGGLIEGDISVGAFRFDPDEPTEDGHTGFSAAGSLLYRPSRRTALTLDAFSGDVATFRNGATSRTDSTLQFGIQQEIRHNLYASARLGWRSTEYKGTSQTENTVVADGQVEYLLNRNLSIAAVGSYGTRSSDIPTEDFDRFRGGLELRARF